MSTKHSDSETPLEGSKGADSKKTGFEDLDSALTIEQIVSLHLNNEEGVIIQAGGGYSTVIDKEVIRRFDKPYMIVDPAKTSGGRNQNIEWMKSTHLDVIDRLEEDDLYVTTDVQGVLSSVREYKDERRVKLGLFSGYQKDMEDAMTNWTNKLTSADAEIAVAVQREDIEPYVEKGLVSEKAYEDILEGLNGMEISVSESNDWSIIRANYSK